MVVSAAIFAGAVVTVGQLVSMWRHRPQVADASYRALTLPAAGPVAALTWLEVSGQFVSPRFWRPPRLGPLGSGTGAYETELRYLAGLYGWLDEIR